MNSDEFAGYIKKARKHNNYYSGCCPSHNDKRPSLIWFDSPKGDYIALKCQSNKGCDTKTILSSLGLKNADLQLHQSVRRDNRGQSKKGFYRQTQRDLLDKIVDKGSSI